MMRKPAPRARRIRSAGWGDARLWLGVGLVVVSMLVGAKVMTAGTDTVTVWRATRDLSVGSRPVDLAPVGVDRATAGDRYVAVGGIVDGVLRWPIGAGELLPQSALAEASAESVRWVTLPVDPLHAPVGVQPGDIVDVWATARESAGSLAAAPVAALTGARVAALTTDAIGVGGELGIVLEVPAPQVSAVVSAARSGVIDLVAVPVGSQHADSALALGASS